ncbi:MAG: histone deacetylase [Bryobacteraceae bacterium]
MLRLFHCDHHAFALPADHKFPSEKYRLLREKLAQTGRFRFSESPAVSESLLAATHDSIYVRSFLDGTVDPRIMRRIGFPWSEGLVRRTLASVGGTLSAADDALNYGFGGNLAGGTHHALREEGAGFCVFNDIAVVARNLLESRRVGRVAVVDLDVHQGDGTAVLLAGEPRAITLSLHGRNNFPFRKQRSSIDIELADGTEDDEYLMTLDSVLPQVAEFVPDIVFYQSGVDALATDRLGRLSLTPAGMAIRDERVAGLCRSLGVPLVITLGGGYSKPIAATVDAHAATFLTAARILAA